MSAVVDLMAALQNSVNAAKAARAAGLTTTATLERDPCPDCDGTGEIQAGQPIRNAVTGVWDVETRICNTCDGTGNIPDWMLVCDSDNGAHGFDATEHRCGHGRVLCAEHVFECRVCAAEDTL